MKVEPINLRTAQQTTSRALARPAAASATIWLWAIVAASAVLRLATLGNRSFWLDEGVSYVIALRPLPALIDFVGTEDIHPPLYYLLLHAWLLAGDAEFWLRLPSAAFGVVSVWLIGLLGRWLIDARAGLVAAAILAVSPLHVWFAQEARMYSLVVMLALAMAACLWRALMATDRAGWWWTGVALIGALMLYTSTTSIWVLAPLNLFLLGYVLIERRWSVLRGWALSHLAMGLLFLPWAPMLLTQLAVSRRLGYWIVVPTVGAVTNLLADFNSRNLTFWFRAELDQLGLRETFWAATDPLIDLGFVNMVFIGTILTAAAILTLRQRRPGQWLLWCLLIAPIGLAFVLSQKYLRLPLLYHLLDESQSIFTVKNLIVASLPYYLLTAMVLTRGRRWPLIAGLTVLFGLNLVSYQLEGSLRIKEDWRGVAATLYPQLRPTDVVVFSPGYLEPGYAYYARDRSPIAPERGFPTDDLALHTPAVTRTAEEVVAGASRVWLIESPRHAPQSSALADALAATGPPAWEQTWPGITVRRYDAVTIR